MGNENRFSVSQRSQNITESEYRNLTGRLYTVTATSDLNDGDTTYIHCTTGDKPIITNIGIESSGKMAYTLYEDASSMDITGGTALETVCLNRVEPENENTTWLKDPTVNNSGTELLEIETTGSSGATGGGPNAEDSTAGSSRRGTNWIFKANTEYLIEVEDLTTDSNVDTVTFIISFNESEYNLFKD